MARVPDFSSICSIVEQRVKDAQCETFDSRTCRNAIGMPMAIDRLWLSIITHSPFDAHRDGLCVDDLCVRAHLLLDERRMGKKGGLFT